MYFSFLLPPFHSLQSIHFYFKKTKLIHTIIPKLASHILIPMEPTLYPKKITSNQEVVRSLDKGGGRKKSHKTFLLHRTLVVWEGLVGHGRPPTRWVGGRPPPTTLGFLEFPFWLGLGTFLEPFGSRKVPLPLGGHSGKSTDILAYNGGVVPNAERRGLLLKTYLFLPPPKNAPTDRTITNGQYCN